MICVKELSKATVITSGGATGVALTPWVVAGARLFLSYLQGVDEPPSRHHRAAAAEPDLLKLFCAWMRERRGTCDRALYNYSIPILELIKRISGDPSALDAPRLRQFVLEQNERPMGSAALPDSATYVPAVSDRRGSLPCGPAGCNSRRTVLASDLASAISAARRCGAPHRMLQPSFAHWQAGPGHTPSARPPWPPRRRYRANASDGY